MCPCFVQGLSFCTQMGHLPKDFFFCYGQKFQILIQAFKIIKCLFHFITPGDSADEDQEESCRTSPKISKFV